MNHQRLYSSKYPLTISYPSPSGIRNDRYFIATIIIKLISQLVVGLKAEILRIEMRNWPLHPISVHDDTPSINKSTPLVYYCIPFHVIKIVPPKRVTNCEVYPFVYKFKFRRGGNFQNLIPESNKSDTR